MKIIIILILTYILGSAPFSYIVGKKFMGVDLRTKGSGNLGATNVTRVVGKKAGLVAFVLDLAKGAFGYLIGYLILGQLGGAIGGAAAIVGHCYSMFTGLKGGKGVSTTVGVLLASNPLVLLILAAVQVLVIKFTKFMSLASIISGLMLPVIVYFISNDKYLFFASLFIGPFVVFRHHSNIGRLLRGEESKFKL